MPYIKPERRKVYDPMIVDLVVTLRCADVDKMDGELNYVITKVLKSVYGPSYFDLNRAVGVLECIKQEFYRRVVAPYEDRKRKEWGDVY